MRKSTSAIGLKTMPVEEIVFNPREFEVGESRINKLPSRVLPRRNSLASLARTEKPTLVKEQKELEVSLLQKINERLSK